MNFTTRSLLLGLSLTPVLLMGCTKARMAMRPELVSVATEMKVEGRKNFSFDETFSFGEYQVAEVRRGWTRSSSFGATGLSRLHLNVSSGTASQKYEFILKHGAAGSWKCHSATECDQQNANLLIGGKSRSGITLTSKKSFVCVFASNDGPQTWNLAMNENYESRGVMKGVLSDGNVSIVIQGTRKLSGSPLLLSEHTGYEFLMNDQVIGAVEVINKGAIWIAPTVEAKLHPPLAVASAALLLYQDVSSK